MSFHGYVFNICIVHSRIFRSKIQRKHTLKLPWQQWLSKRKKLLRYKYTAYFETQENYYPHFLSPPRYLSMYNLQPQNLTIPQAYNYWSPNTVHLWTSIILYQNSKMVFFFGPRNGVTQECCCQWDINIPIYVTVPQLAFRI